MMKIYYLANIRLPTEKAHGIQIMKMCEAFAFFGAKVELVVPRRFNAIKEKPFEYYGVKNNFRIKKIFSFDLVKFGKIGFWIQSFSFAKFAAIYTLLKNPDVIYSRDALPLFFLNFFRKNIFWEAHRGEFNFMIGRLLKKCRGIVAITRGLKDFYLKNGADAKKILVAPDGVDLKEFNIDISKEKARERLNLPQDKKIILYTGHLYDWKGAVTLLKVAQQFSVSDFQFSDKLLFVFVGGMEKDIKSFKVQALSFGLNNVLFVGHRPHQEMPFWLKAADVLVLPNSAKEKISEFYTSPMKMFEYMASGRPIVASDLPSIREVLEHGKNAVLVKPDMPEFLIDGIKEALENSELAGKISKQAYLDVQNHTWEKRAGQILNFISETIFTSAIL